MGVATTVNENTLFAMLVGRATQFEAHRGQFSSYSTDLPCLQVAKVPRC